ncbi:MAG TPA: alpha-2-macroglobulin family protein, partial [Candidatus Methylacidiphilales bacterium]|nr:alpha-2-macroglobulin family protein [Candidatus Methylacidiphilales bacterium]
WAALASESLGDHDLAISPQPSIETALAHYIKALGIWASLDASDSTRQNYLRVLLKPFVADPERLLPQWELDSVLLDKSLGLPLTPSESAQVRFLLALSLMHKAAPATPATWTRITENLSPLLGNRVEGPWLDDALMLAARWTERYGTLVEDESNETGAGAAGYIPSPDLPGALPYYRRISDNYTKDNSKYFAAARAAANEITTPSLTLSATRQVMPDVPVPYVINVANVKEIEVQISKYDLPQGFQPDGTPDARNVPRLWSEMGIGPLVRSWKVTAGHGKEFFKDRLELSTEPLAPGAYWMRVSSPGNLHDGALLLVSRGVVQFSEADGKVNAWVVDATTGLPFANARTTLYSFKRHAGGTQTRKPRVETTMLQALTNVDGLATFTLPAQPDPSKVVARMAYQALAAKDSLPEGDALAIIAMVGDSPAIAVSNFLKPTNYSMLGRELQICAITDSPAYRPGDELQFRLICRERLPTGLKTPAGLSINVTVRDPDKKPVLEKTYTLNDFGSVADKLQLSDDMPLGQYHIEVKRTDNPIETAASQSGTFFTLDSLRLPEYRVEILAPQREDGTPVGVSPGSRLRPRVRVTYYGGGPVPDAKVEYSARLDRMYVENPFANPKDWLYQDLNLGENGKFSPWLEFPTLQTDSGSHSPTIANGTTTTDAKGEAVLDIPIPEYVAQSGLILNARVMDSSRRVVEGSQNITISKRPFLMKAQLRSRILTPGEPVEIDIATMDPVRIEGENAPTPGSGIAIVTRERFIRRILRNKRTGAEKVVFQGYEAVEVLRQPIATLAATGRTLLNFPAPAEGYYRVRIVPESIARNIIQPQAGGTPPPAITAPAPVPPKSGRASGSGKKNSGQTAGTAKKRAREGSEPEPITVSQLKDVDILAEAEFFSCTARTRDLGYRPSNLQIISDKAQYAVGDTARILIIPPTETGTNVWLTLRGKSLLSNQVLRIEGAARRLDIPVTSDWQPNAELQANYLSARQFQSTPLNILVPRPDRNLNVELMPDSETPRPGEKTKWQISVRDIRGLPVRAEVSLGVVDASVFTLTEAQPSVEATFFDRNSFIGRDSMSLSIPFHQEGDESSFPASDTEEIIRTDSPRGVIEVDSISSDSREQSGRSKPKGPPAPPPSEGEPPDLMHIIEDNGNYAAPSGITVRSNFKLSSCWEPHVLTDEKGMAQVEFTYPDNLTEWQATARVVTTGQQFGDTNKWVSTTRPATVRLQMPRFVVEGDRVTLTAVAQNLTSRIANFTADILSSSELVKLGQPVGPNGNTGTMTLDPNGVARTDVPFEVRAHGGEAQVTATLLRSDGEGDSMRSSLPIVEHGIERLVSTSFMVEAGSASRPGERWVDFNLNLPEVRDRSGLSLEIQLTPSLASTCLDALPYLARFPYGCTEQTISRYLPAAVAAQTLRELKQDPAAIAGRLSESGEITVFPGGLRLQRGKVTLIEDMVRQGNDLLIEGQNQNGGWGWWKGDPSNDYMTAYVLQGLSLATRASLPTEGGMARRAADYLRTRLINYDNDPEMLAWILYSLAISDTDWTQNCDAAADKAWANREKLTPCSRALLALAFHHREIEQPQYSEYALTLVRNLENGVREERSSAVASTSTASASPHLGADGKPIAQPQPPADSCFWGVDGPVHRWTDGPVEATAYALRAMLAIDPLNPRVEMAARWLTNHRIASRWSNTRDTAVVVLTLLEYMRITQELTPDFKAELLINGQSIQHVSCTRDQVLGTLIVSVPEAQLKPGNNPIQIRMSGKGRLYTSARLRYFSKESPIPASGTDITIKREYFRERTVPLLLGGTRVERDQLK